MSNLPMLGAALPIEALEPNLDWLVAGRRDLELQSFYSPEALMGDWKPKAEKAKTLLQSHQGRLGIHGPFLGFSIVTEDPDVRAVVQRRLGQGLDVCEELGASHMVIHSPVRSWDHENLLNDISRPQKFVDYFRLAMDDIVSRAEKLNVALMLENIEDRDPHARVELVRLYDSPALRASIDTGHAHYAHTIGNAPAVDRYVRAAGDLLGHVHLQDADGFADRHWALGEGTVPWRAVFEELGHLTSNPRLIIELRDSGKVQSSARWMQDCGLAQ